MPVVQEVPDDSESGRGLFLVSSMADGWGHYLPSAGGKVVWADVALAKTAASRVHPANVWQPLPKRQGRTAEHTRPAAGRSADVGLLETALWNLQRTARQEQGRALSRHSSAGDAASRQDGHAVSSFSGESV